MSVERFRITATLVGGKSPRADHGDSPRGFPAVFSIPCIFLFNIFDNKDLRKSEKLVAGVKLLYYLQ